MGVEYENVFFKIYGTLHNMLFLKLLTRREFFTGSEIYPSYARPGDV